MSLDTQLQSAFTAVGNAVKGKISSSEKGANNGVATLDGAGKLTASQLPSIATGGMVYQGVWDASTNSPAIPAASAGNKGYYYKVSVAGTTTVDTINDWKVGDWIVSNGATWDKIDNTDAVSSVAGRTGAIVLTKTDVGLANVDNTSDANKPISTATQAVLDLKATIASPVFTGTPTLPTGTIAVTQTAGNSSTAVATTAFVTGAIATVNTNVGATNTDYVAVFNAALV